MERLVSLLKQSKVDDKQAASQLDKVLAAEREIKRAQLMLLIRIKNNLTTRTSRLADRAQQGHWGRNSVTSHCRDARFFVQAFA
jgi:hypothetical protein